MEPTTRSLLIRSHPAGCAAELMDDGRIVAYAAGGNVEECAGAIAIGQAARLGLAVHIREMPDDEPDAGAGAEPAGRLSDLLAGVAAIGLAAAPVTVLVGYVRHDWEAIGLALAGYLVAAGAAAAGILLGRRAS